ncbi:MAG: hypothetical protein RLZZ165_528 [Bacteroidota bacterium]
MIEGLKSLHDVRYCAAVGIGIVSFEMDPGSPEALSPAMVKEIMDWISGVEAVGWFGDAPFDAIANAVIASSIQGVVVPMGRPLDELFGLGVRVIVDATRPKPDLLGELMERYPYLLALVEIEPSLSGDTAWDFSRFQDRLIMRCNVMPSMEHILYPNAAQPFGISLGAMVRSEDGFLDYEACDSLLQTYHVRAPVAWKDA